LANRIWIDVEDLFKWGIDGHRPSGIQRLEFELCRALFELPQSKDRVFFVRHDAGRQCFTATSWEAVETVFGSISSRRLEELNATSVIATARAVLKTAIRALPPGLREIVFRQIEVFMSLARLVRAYAVGIARALQRCWRSRNTAAAASSDHFASAARPGDILAALGAPWVEPEYGVYIERVKRDKGLRFALLIYDIIPLRRPEWYDVRLTKRFRVWLADTLPLADMVLTISTATAADVTGYARNKGLPLRAVATPIPIGTGFKKSYAAQRRSPDGIVSSRLPAPNSYALIVSTIEPRKNHILLFRVWRRLMEDMRAASVPTLVFAGRVGWLVSDLMEQLHNSSFLDGKIIVIESPTDEELEGLYAGCLFTLFPSFYEGWGLPVTESHAFGRPCIISKTTSLPEAGGSLARYIDPDNTTDAYRVIRETIQDQAGLREWRDRVHREFRPVEWSQSARAVLNALDATEDASRAREPQLQLHA
jgi:glycosyltransferase involved in cell wall biosynthesis